MPDLTYHQEPDLTPQEFIVGNLLKIVATIKAGGVES